MIPVGADIAFEDGSLKISAKVAGILLQIFPRPPKEEKPTEEPKPPVEKAPEKEKPEKKPRRKLKLDFTFDEIIELLKKVLRGFGVLGRKFRVDRFKFDFLAAGWDPYLTARFFGYVNAGINILAPICAQRFDVKDLYVRTDIDFTTDEMKFDFGIALTIRIGAILHMLNTILLGVLTVLIKHKLRKVKEKSINKSDGIPEIQPETDSEQIDKNIQQDERND